NLPQHVQVIDHRPKIRDSRPPCFKGIRYSNGVSKLSSVSKVFYSLSSRKPDYLAQGYQVEEVDGELIKVTIKERETLDGLDGLGRSGVQNEQKAMVEHLSEPNPTKEQTPPELHLTCEDCRFWSRNQCSKHPEWVTVTPLHPACELYEPKKEDVGQTIFSQGEKGEDASSILQEQASIEASKVGEGKVDLMEELKRSRLEKVYRCKTCGCGPWRYNETAKEHKQLFPTHEIMELSYEEVFGDD
ncbi:MAG: hypothetical protein ACPL07_01945, partial [Candidatus Bathyarchaeia archaeon]